MSKGEKIALIIFILFLISQVFQPKNNQGDYNLKPFFEETGASAKVQTILFNACADCHSNQTKYPWYSKITPGNFWMAHHVDEGKEHLNFSDWSTFSPKKKAHKLEETIEELEEGEMPLKSYTWIHKEAKLTQEETALLIDWATKAKTSFE